MAAYVELKQQIRDKARGRGSNIPLCRTGAPVERKDREVDARRLYSEIRDKAIQPAGASCAARQAAMEERVKT